MIQNTILHITATKEHISRYIVRCNALWERCPVRTKVMYNVACAHKNSEMFSRLLSEDKVYLYVHITLFLKDTFPVSGQPGHSVGNDVKSRQALAMLDVSPSPKSTFVEFLMRYDGTDNCSHVL